MGYTRTYSIVDTVAEPAHLWLAPAPAFEISSAPTPDKKPGPERLRQHKNGYASTIVQ